MAPTTTDKISYERWGDPVPWVLGSVLVGWLGLLVTLFLVTTEANGSTDGCIGRAELSDYQQCARDEEVFILNVHSGVVALGFFSVVLAVRGIWRREVGRKLQHQGRDLIVAVVLGVMVVTVTGLWRVFGGSGIAVHDRPFDPIPVGQAILRVAAGALIGMLVAFVPRNLKADAMAKAEHPDGVTSKE